MVDVSNSVCVCVCVLFQAEEEESVDKYHGLRVHCWVLVLSGKREVPQSFFIEPTTGEGTTNHVHTVFTVCVCMCVCVCVCVCQASVMRWILSCILALRVSGTTETTGSTCRTAPTDSR